MFVATTLSMAVLSLFLLHVRAVQFQDCGSISGKVASVGVDGCAEEAESCVLKRGSQAHFSIDFKDLADVTSVQAKVHGIIAGVPVPFPLPQVDACQNSGIQCPLKSGNAYSYATTINVLESYPPISVLVKWELQDPSNSKDVVCVTVKTQLQ